MDANYLKWNAPNWITVFLMVMIAHAAIGFTYSVFKGAGSSDD